LKVPAATVRANERRMALSLIEQMTGEWDPTEHPNVYRKALEKLLATKRAVAVEEQAPEEKQGAKVVNLMEALKRSLADRERPTRSSAGSRTRPRRGRGKATARRR
jgi:DNA end-binding protein Ku